PAAQTRLVGSIKKCPVVVPDRQLPCRPSELGLNVCIWRGSWKTWIGPRISGRSKPSFEKLAPLLENSVKGFPDWKLVMVETVQPPNAFFASEVAFRPKGISQIGVSTRRWVASKSASPRSKGGVSGLV